MVNIGGSNLFYRHVFQRDEDLVLKVCTAPFPRRYSSFHRNQSWRFESAIRCWVCPAPSILWNILESRICRMIWVSDLCSHVRWRIMQNCDILTLLKLDLIHDSKSWRFESAICCWGCPALVSSCGILSYLSFWVRGLSSDLCSHVRWKFMQ